MLPLWRDRLRIALCPDRVIVMRLGRGRRAQVIAKQIVDCTPAPNQPGGRAPLDALAQLLATPQWQNADATVILSNYFVRYALVPWSDEISDEQEEAAYVKLCFSKIYGAAADAWTLRLSEERRGTPGMASAVDSKLLAELETVCATGKLRLRSVQPYLMPVFNQARHSIAEQTCWLVLAEPGKLCMALVHKGRWRSVGVRQVSEKGWAPEMLLLLDRESRLADVGNGARKVFLFAPEQSGLSFPAGGKWMVQKLTAKPQAGFAPETETQYAMAMAGLT